MVNPMDEPTMGGLNGTIDMPPKPQAQRERNQGQIDAWRWGVFLVTLGWVAFIAFMLYSTFGGKP